MAVLSSYVAVSRTPVAIALLLGPLQDSQVAARRRAPAYVVPVGVDALGSGPLQNGQVTAPSSAVHHSCLVPGAGGVLCAGPLQKSQVAATGCAAAREAPGAGGVLCAGPPQNIQTPGCSCVAAHILTARTAQAADPPQILEPPGRRPTADPRCQETAQKDG